MVAKRDWCESVPVDGNEISGGDPGTELDTVGSRSAT